MPGLVPTGTAVMALGPFRLTPRGLEVHGDPSFEEWRRAGKTLSLIEANGRWWLGDLLAYGETRSEWGDKYAHECSILGRSYGDVRNLKSLSTRFQLSRRRDNLSWDHHATVSGLPTDD